MSDPFEKKNIFGKAINNGDSAKAQLEHQNDALDEALRESFPASDPIAVIVTRITKDTPVERTISQSWHW